MTQAVPARALGSFEERPPAPALLDTFSSVWVHQIDEPAPLLVTPDATIDLQWIDGQFRVAGPDTDPQVERVTPGDAVIGFRFQPAAAAAWLGVPASALVGQRVALEDLWGSEGKRLADRVGEAQGDVITAIETAIAERAIRRGTDARMRAAFLLTESSPPPGAPIVPWLMRALGMSERTLRRRFDEHFGYGPKTLDRILRYQRFLRISRDGRDPTSIRAVEAGYADQAHLVRESRRLTHTTPRQFLRAFDDTPSAHRG